MRKICVVTGTRAEYSLLKRTMLKIKGDLRLQVVATGMHLMEELGSTYRIIEQDGFCIDAKVHMEDTSMAGSIAKGITGLSAAFRDLNPDIVLILGDRIEPLAAAIAAAYQRRVIAHIHGGDVSGGLDEYNRHAITKFSHIHMAVSKRSMERIIRLGERREHVFNVGSPGLENTLLEAPSDEFRHKLGIGEGEYILLVQHPVTTQAADAGRQFQESLAAARGSGKRIVVIYPNSDEGSSQILRIIEEAQKRKEVIAFKNLEVREYLTLMRNAACLLGNSSSGILEAPSYRLPVVNVGNRQDGREKAINVIDAGYGRQEISDAIMKATSRSFRESLKKMKNPYGDGKASDRIVEILSGIETKGMIEKRITY